MADSNSMPLGGKASLRPPRGAETALDAGSVVKAQGKTSPEPGAVPGVFGGTGNSQAVGGGKKKGQGPQSLQA